MRIRHLQLFILLFIFQHGPAQDTRLDSLRTMLVNLEHQVSRVDILNEMAGLAANNAPDEAIKFASDARLIAENEEYPEGTALAWKNLGLGHYFLGEYADAVKAWETGLGIYEELGDEKLIANLISNLGAVYFSMGQNAEAVEYYLRSLKIAESIGDKERIATLLLNIGAVYSAQASARDTAKSYYLRALDMAEDLGDEDMLAMANQNMGNIFMGTEEFDSAMVYLERSIEFSSSPILTSTALAALGQIYAERKDFEKAVAYQKEALEMAEAENARMEMAKINSSLAGTYKDMGEYRTAITYLERSMELAKEVGLNEELSWAYEGLSDSWAELGDFRNAYKFLALQNEIDDVIYRIEAEDKTRSLMFGYQLEKKQDEIAILEQQSEIDQLLQKRQRAMNIAFALFGFFVLILAGGIYNRMRFVRRTNRKIEAQKKRIEIQHDLVLAQKEMITDSINYAQRIQSALLPSEKLMLELMPEHFVMLKPKDIVSGDFYWMKEVQDHLVIMGADCTGHGVPGAFMSMLGITLLNEMVGDRCFNAPGAIMEQLRTRIKELLVQQGEDDEQKDGMDAVLVVLNKLTREIHFSGANNPLFIIREKNGEVPGDLEPYASLETDKHQLFDIKGDKQPIGVYWDETPFTTHSLQLKEGDSFYMFSDGFVDQFGGENRKKFKVVAFKKLLLSIQEQDMVKQKITLEKAFEAWRGDIEQIDDVSVIGVRL